MNSCLCGAIATHRCRECNPKVLLCKNCIFQHISENSDDSIIRLKPETQVKGAPKCDICLLERAVTLHVLTNHAEKLCKSCKLKSSKSVHFELKWSNIITKSSEIELFYQRQAALNNCKEEIENSRVSDLFRTNLKELKDGIIRAANLAFDERMEETKEACEEHELFLMKVEKEVQEQILRKVPDSDAISGRLVNSFLTRGAAYKLPTPFTALANVEKAMEQVKSLFYSAKIESNLKKKAYVYLFNPGKNTLTRVCVESMRKFEFVFDKSWTFEASWAELDSGDLFFCGGNGIDNSEVMMIKMNPIEIKGLDHFTGRSGHSIVESNRNIYVIGGNKGNFAEKYSFDAGKWFILAAIPQRMARTSAALINDTIVFTGADCDRIYIYNSTTDNYTELCLSLDGYAAKNKILFFHNNTLYCMTGDKLFFCVWGQKSWNISTILDRDWWTYSRPVHHNNSIYFIKYFVRNLWQLNLNDHKLNETQLSLIPEGER